MSPQAGLFTIPAADYLADAGHDVPTLNSSIARVLLAESPWHAWTRHPRLNPDYQPEAREAFDLGTAFHSMMLEGGDAFAVIDAEDYRTKEAKGLRDAARAAGKAPVKAGQWANLLTMERAVHAQLMAFDGSPTPLGDGGAPEQTIVWEEDGVWCRGRLDWLHANRRTVDDLKTTNLGAHPDAWGRTLFNMGLDVQAGFYLRGLKRLFNVEAECRFLVCELTPPYAVSVVALAPDALALADRKVSRAITLWRECLATNTWPGYSPRTHVVDAPPWEYARFNASEPDSLYDQAARLGRGETL